MGTASLWGTIELDSVLWATPRDADKMMSLLEAALTRGCNCPLSVSVIVGDAGPHVPALALLAAHSERWKTAKCSTGLSHLETLKLWGVPSHLNIFETAPRLRRLEFGGTPANFMALAQLPLRQLHDVGWVEMWGLGTLKTAIENLTLPSLETFELNAQEYPRLPLPWPHAEFLGLSARSSFHTHLLCLSIPHSVVTVEQLLECLANLPALEELEISDHQLIANGGADQRLITDALLTHLTRTPHFCVVSRLSSFKFQSLLHFDDTVYLAFLLSRVGEATLNDGGDGDVFESEILWSPGHHR
ncbi:hypothetical protein C8R44DRAFT_928598 [Mycena epipterygia]|nr:hypothetical protein C8R44DRAFT_928598 [Mycena epipterygia]